MFYWWEATAEQPDVTRYRYIHLRTRMALHLSTDVVQALGEAGLSDVEMMRFPTMAPKKPRLWEGEDDDEPEDEDPCKTWADGLLIRVTTRDTPAELAKQFSRPLREFDAWGIHDGQGRFAESVKGGLLSSYFGSAGPASAKSSIILIMNAQHDRWPDRTCDAIKTQLSPKCRAVIHFRDGRILMTPDQPARTIINRLGPATRKLAEFAVCDHAGESLNTAVKNDTIWESVDLGYEGFAEYLRQLVPIA